MIKYSLVVLAAAAVIMSSGCDDSECCGGKKVAVKPAKKIVNVAPVVTKVFGLTNNSTKECEAGKPVTLNASASDENKNLDSSTYSWVEKIGNNENTLGTTITCPAETADATNVCVTVKDKKGLESNEVCVKLKAKAVSATCPKPTITAIDITPNFDNNAIDGGNVAGGHDYNFKYSWANGKTCPNMTCKWFTLKSAGKTSPDDKVCINNGEVSTTWKATHTPDISSNPVTASTIKVKTCGESGNETITAVVRCTNNSTHETKDSTATFTIVNEDTI